MVAEERKQELKEASRALGAKNAAKKKASSCPDYTIDQLLDKVNKCTCTCVRVRFKKFCQIVNIKTL